MTLTELLAQEGKTPGAFARHIGCHRSIFSHVLAGRKDIGRPLAIKIFKKTGAKIGPIAGASDSDIAVLERLG